MKWLKPAFYTLLFFNPLMFLLMFKNWWIAIFIPLIIFIGAYNVKKLLSLRIKIWLFNIFAIIGIAFNAELIFRINYSSLHVPNIYEIRNNYYFNKPFLNQTFKDDEYLSHYYTNTQGYRIDNYSNPKELITECDWLFLGDSFTQGAQVEYDEMFSSLLYHHFPDKVIVNAGMSGAGLYESLNYLKDEGVKLNPKKIILQIGAFNDFYNIQEHHAVWSDYLMEASEIYRYLQFHLFDNPSLPLGRWTEPFFKDEEDNKNFNIFFKKSSELKKKDLQAFKNVLSEFKNEANKLGAELIVFLIPTKEQISDDLFQEVLEKYNIDKDEIDLMAPNNLTNETCQSLNIPFIDCFPSFKLSRSFPFFQKDEHLNIIGHQLISEALKLFFEQNPSVFEIYSKGNFNERYPTFFNDGNTVLFQSQSSETSYIKYDNISRAYENVIFKSNQDLIHPQISPDGKWLAYTSGDQDHDDTDIILVNLDNNEVYILNPKGYHGAIPCFSHDSNLISFPVWKDNANPCIYVTEIKTQKEICKIGDSKQETWRPIFTHDDSKILYLKMDDKNKFGIWEYNIVNRRDRLIFKTDFNIWDIAISPSGNHLAFAGNKNGNWDLFTLDLNTLELRQLTNTIGNEWDPVYRTEDELWFAGEFGFNNGIYIMYLNR